MIGQTISHYQIKEKLGEGGMGIVYKARDLKLDRLVALKFLPPHLTRSEEEKQRFIHEAKAASALDHPNICNIHEIDTTEDGQLFISMSYYEGETLNKQFKCEKLLPLTKAIDFAIQITQGLTEAHVSHIIHRDLKPANIMITSKGEVKILDFGLAKKAGQTRITKESTTLGTVAYMSPEQTKGEAVDQRSDIWSLGVILYEMVTGQVPFKADYEQAVMYSILNEEPQPVTALRTGIPIELELIISKCLEKDPARRYQRAEELIVDLQRLKKKSDKSSLPAPSGIIPRKKGKRTIFYTISGILLTIFIILLIQYVFLPLQQPTSDSDRKMLVVLPFENLGPVEDAYFTDGITDEITGRLGTIQNIGVISRNSASHYAGKIWDTKEVGKDLNVEYIIAGTVRWSHSPEEVDRVRVTPRLIRVSDDIELWAEPFDRKVDDIFDIQSEIAMNVAERLGITLGKSEQRFVEESPTKDIEAYQAFLQGRHYARSPHFTVKNWMQVIYSYQRAVELDSTFAIAYAELAGAHARLYFLRHDMSKERFNLAKEAADQAEKLAPDAPEVLLALGYYHLWAQRDSEQALRKWTLAEKGLHNDPRILEAKANLYETQGRWDEAIQAIEKASRFSPRDASLTTHLAFYYWVTRQYPQSIEKCNEAIALAPNENWPYLYKAFAIWSWKGANEESAHAIAGVHPDYHWVPWAWFWQDVGERKYDRALDRLSKYPDHWIRNKMWVKPKSLLEAMVYDFMGKPDLARSGYQAAVLSLETEVEKWPEDPRYHSALGITYGLLGRKEEAVREGKKAVELLPLSKDAAYGIPFAEDLAQIYTIIGDEEMAIDQIEMLFTIPSWISVQYLKINPLYDRLKDNPRFQKLIQNHAQGF
jgi:serine/threonine protein kinase/tetratricopeptide (TPR) repeat protein